MNKSIYNETKASISELCEEAKLKEGDIVVVGCSTSEVVGSQIGTNSNYDVAGEIFRALYEYTKNGTASFSIIMARFKCSQH